jgi:signal transduction histidine kinase
MRPYRDLSITTKLSLLVLLAGGVALALATICFVWDDVAMIRASTVEKMTILANVLASQSTAALDFQRNDDATELLNSLKTDPSVESACIYDAKNKPFATYSKPGQDFQPPPAPREMGPQFIDGYLDLAEEITKNEEPIGKIFLRANLGELRKQMLRYLAIVAVMVVFSMGTSLLLSSRFQRVISAPILKLAEAAQRISQKHDFGIRVVKTANDEIGALYDQFNDMLDQIQQGEAALHRAHDGLEAKVVQRTAELSRANEELSREISVRLQTEHELESTHQQLLDAASRAGMAEIATGVLHNVGNVLNSINVSATLVYDRMKQSKVADLARAIKLMEDHGDQLGTYITTDPKGKQLPAFLSLLAHHLSDERTDVARELELLTEKVGHVKAIVATQQSYAGVSGVLEVVDIAATLEDALKLELASFERHKIVVEKEYQDIAKVRIDKQKVLQILVNLLKNARESLCERQLPLDRRVTLRTSVSDETMLQIQVSDNGVGIPAENLTRIFSHGFTTKKTGHGFGLHGCANAAGEMGGSLTARSDGAGRGAAFVLEIPYVPVKVPAHV